MEHEQLHRLVRLVGVVVPPPGIVHEGLSGRVVLSSRDADGTRRHRGSSVPLCRTVLHGQFRVVAQLRQQDGQAGEAAHAPCRLSRPPRSGAEARRRVAHSEGSSPPFPPSKKERAAGSLFFALPPPANSLRGQSPRSKLHFTTPPVMPWMNRSRKKL